jgi:hypothetical protein
MFVSGNSARVAFRPKIRCWNLAFADERTIFFNRPAAVIEVNGRRLDDKRPVLFFTSSFLLLKTDTDLHFHENPSMSRDIIRASDRKIVAGTPSGG